MNQKHIKPIAFYLPQFHPIPENNRWWGEGFTEWNNVKKAQPNFEGHYQPHVPAGLNYYDLRNSKIMEDQAKIAKQYGIHGFCFYWYWFNGKRLLEKPLYDVLENKTVDTNFCFCWANENWTRTWDGREKDILMGQDYDSNKLDSEFIDEMLPFFKDDRYIKVDGKPMLLIYRCDIIPNLKSLVNKWRDQVKKHGFPDLHLVSVYSFENDRYDKFGFDAGVEFPPHNFFSSSDSVNSKIKITNPNFSGMIIDYKSLISRSLRKNWPKNSVVYRGLTPSWDNTARRQNNPHILSGSSPDLFHVWLNHSIAKSRECNNEFIFINAWNEWGEGCHLEADEKYKTKYLEALQSALKNIEAPTYAKKDFASFDQTFRPHTALEQIKRILRKQPALWTLTNKLSEIYKRVR